KFRRSLLRRPVTGFSLLCDMLWLYLDCQPANDSTGYVIRLDPFWQIWGPAEVLLGSDYCRTAGATEVEACERVNALLRQLVGKPVTRLEAKPGSNALAVEVGEQFLMQTFLQDPTAQDSWAIDDYGRRVSLYGSPRGLEVVRRH